MYESIIIIIFHVIILFSKTNQHTLDECHAAATCVHDGKAVCASNDMKEHRKFLDSCDMHEYNCDYGTDYNAIEACFYAPTTTTEEFVTEESNTEELTTEEPVFKPITTENDPDFDFDSRERLKKTVTTHQAQNMNEELKTLNDIFKCSKCQRPHTWETTVKNYESK